MLPIMIASILLKSCATPPVRWLAYRFHFLELVYWRLGSLALGNLLLHRRRPLFNHAFQHAIELNKLGTQLGLFVIGVENYLHHANHLYGGDDYQTRATDWPQSVKRN